MNSHIRPAAKAGSWYSDSPSVLRQQIKTLLENVETDVEAPVIGGIVPHAGLAFSGPTAAKTFRAMQTSLKGLKTLILLGAVHTMYLDTPAVWSQGVWKCPAGDIEVDTTAAAQITSRTCAQSLEKPHFNDNALELQLPFISVCFPDVKIVPIAIPCNSTAANFGEELGAIFKKEIASGETGFIASSDLTHYGEAYGFAPAGMGNEALGWARENDNRLLELAKDLQADKIIHAAIRDSSACGGGAIAASCAVAKACGSSGGVILEHTNSHEIMPRPNIDLFVGYAAMVFLK